MNNHSRSSRQQVFAYLLRRGPSTIQQIEVHYSHNRGSYAHPFQWLEREAFIQRCEPRSRPQLWEVVPGKTDAMLLDEEIKYSHIVRAAYKSHNPDVTKEKKGPAPTRESLAADVEAFLAKGNKVEDLGTYAGARTIGRAGGKASLLELGYAFAIALILYVSLWGYPSYACESKAEKMGVYAWEYEVIEGCLVKDKPDSNWRDVHR